MNAPQKDPQIESLKVPPHSIEAEQSVLGGLLLDNAAWDRIAVHRENADSFSACDLGVQMYCGYLPHQSYFNVINLFTVGVSTGTGGLRPPGRYGNSRDNSV